MKRAATIRTLAAMAALLLACQTFGPRSLRYGRGTYNAAIQQTNSQYVEC